MENSSQPPDFETDEERNYFLCTLPVHPLAKTILGSDEELSGEIDKQFIFKNLIEINPYLSLSVSSLGDRDREAIRNSISPKAKQIRRTTVASSNIASVGYDAEKQILEIDMH